MNELPAKTKAGLGLFQDDTSHPGRDFGVFVGLISTLIWAYWTTIVTMAERWTHDPQYSHGFLVPVFALAILWVRRDAYEPGGTPTFWGLGLLFLGLALSFYAVRLDLEWLDASSLIVCLAGIVLWVGGWPMLRWAWPGVLFLCFMLPLPFRVEVSLAHPLRRVATVCSTYGLQAFGYPATAEGNVILLDQPDPTAVDPYIRLGVAEACSGLGMLMTFFALSTAAAIILPGPLLDRCLLVASAIPIAVFVNVLRITVTGMAHYSWGEKVGNAIMHDFAGWLMMPLALLILWLELKFLNRLLPPADEDPDAPPIPAWTLLLPAKREVSP